MKKRPIVNAIVLLAFLFVSYKAMRLSYCIYRWNTSGWAVDYLLTGPEKSTIPDDQKHVIFIMVDHYEHGCSATAAEKNRIWCEKFREISDRHCDDYGNGFRYTWFYPYDHHVDEIVADLSDMALNGYGEVEFHWHMGITPKNKITLENYPEKLAEAIQWFQQFGAMVTEEENPRTAFAYIAGVWDLDASRKPFSTGLTNQIQVLHDLGCYADFTFSTIGTAAQPDKINSIYYVKDDVTAPKSHNTGTDAEVGKPVDNEFMIFQGPIGIHCNGSLEYGAIESDPCFRPERIPRWFEANIHVKGRPEWVFIKVYSHGVQSQKVILEYGMEEMLTALKKYCSDRKIKLHYMTSREAYNVVKAAEAGKTGDPEDYRDFHIPKYQNMVRSFRSSQENGIIENSKEQTHSMDTQQELPLQRVNLQDGHFGSVPK